MHHVVLGDGLPEQVVFEDDREFPLATAAAGIRLRMEMRDTELRFSYAFGSETSWTPVDRPFEATMLGDWVSPQGGFTGTYWGIACQDLATRDVWAEFSGFRYTAFER